MTIIKGSDGSWTWNGGKEGAQRFDELAQAEALAKFDELGELCWLQKNPEINEDTWDEYVARVYESRSSRRAGRGPGHKTLGAAPAGEPGASHKGRLGGRLRLARKAGIAAEYSCGARAALGAVPSAVSVLE